MLREIVPPSDCPSCGFGLEWMNQLLYCKNTSCGAQSQKKVEHFAKTMKIKGLGPSAIEKLGLTLPSEIYALSVETLSTVLSSEKVGAKLYAEIENSKSAPLELLLPAFGIHLIGTTATKKLADTVKNIFEIDADSCRRAGLGPKAAQSLLDWLEWDAPYYYEIMPHSWKFTSKPSVERKGVVCISGKLKSFKTKAAATETLSLLGYEVRSSLTKDVTILVNESGVESSKTKQARESGITIVTDLHSFLEK